MCVPVVEVQKSAKQRQISRSNLLLVLLDGNNKFFLGSVVLLIWTTAWICELFDHSGPTILHFFDWLSCTVLRYENAADMRHNNHFTLIILFLLLWRAKIVIDIEIKNNSFTTWGENFSFKKNTTNTCMHLVVSVWPVALALCLCCSLLAPL